MKAIWTSNLKDCRVFFIGLYNETSAYCNRGILLTSSPHFPFKGIREITSTVKIGRGRLRRGKKKQEVKSCRCRCGTQPRDRTSHGALHTHRESKTRHTPAHTHTLGASLSSCINQEEESAAANIPPCLDSYLKGFLLSFFYFLFSFLLLFFCVFTSGKGI